MGRWGGRTRSSGEQAAPAGTKASVRRASGDLLYEGNAWARRVKVAERALRRARERDPDAAEAIDGLERGLRAARSEDSAMREALTRLEAELAICPQPEGPWARAARVEAERTRAGLEGRPDPHPHAPGLRRGWLGLTPVVRNGLIAWVLLAGAAIVALVLGEF